jgi:hypothetical protein
MYSSTVFFFCMQNGFQYQLLYCVDDHNKYIKYCLFFACGCIASRLRSLNLSRTEYFIKLYIVL